MEYPVALSSIGSTNQPDIPADVLASITAGALEIRQQVIWPSTSAQPPGTNNARVTTFLVAPGSPSVTPPSGQNMVLESHTVAIEQVMTSGAPEISGAPVNAFALVGRVTGNDPASPFGDVTGAIWSLSAGYAAGDSSQTPRPANYNNITVALAGVASWYSRTGSGTIELIGGDGGPGPEPGENRPPVADAGDDFNAVAPQIQLDGRDSRDPDNDQLTYSWRVVSGSAVLLQGTTATPIVQLAGGFGAYTFELTVTDPAGLTATDTVVVTFVR
jgi:hypothetical protein